jgi:hypothetical protein
MEWMMRTALRPRDRDTVSGDLLEEYREEIFPVKSRLAANLWYLRQVFSFFNGAWFGMAFGLLLSGWMVISSLVFLIDESWNHSEGRVVKALFDPLAFNSSVEIAVMLLLLYLSPVLPGFLSRRQGGKTVNTMFAGMLASATTFSVTAIAGVIRMNIVLEIIRNRPGWRPALLAFAGSRGVTAQANYYYALPVPERLLIGAATGALAGTIGGLIGKIGLQQTHKLQNS